MPEIAVHVNKCIRDDMKGTARQSPNCIRKQKIRSVDGRYLPHYRNSVKNCFPTHNFTETGQSAAKLWPKWRPSAILNYKNFHIWSRDCHWVPNLYLCTVPNLIKIIWIFIEVAILRFVIWRPSDILNFRGECRTCYRTSMGQHSSKQMFFRKLRALYAFWRQTDEQMDSSDALRPARCHKRRITGCAVALAQC